MNKKGFLNTREPIIAITDKTRKNQMASMFSK